MKDIKQYAKKLKKLLSGMKARSSPRGGGEPIWTIIEAVLQADSDRRQAAKAVEGIKREFLDTNELRVAPVKDIVDAAGRDLPEVRRKAETITRVLKGIFEQCYAISVEYMQKMPKRDLRRHLGELGMEQFESAWVLLRLFDTPAIPVDQTLVDCLKMDNVAPADATVKETQAVLEKLVPPRSMYSAAEFLYKYCENLLPELTKKRKAEAAAAAKAEAERLERERIAAEAAAKAEAQKARLKAQRQAVKDAKTKKTAADAAAKKKKTKARRRK